MFQMTATADDGGDSGGFKEAQKQSKLRTELPFLRVSKGCVARLERERSARI